MPRYSLNAFGRKIPLADTSDPLSKQVGRRLQGQPDTKIDSGGSVNSFTFDGQEISSSELREIREIRESGGVISALMRSKALLTFGAGVSFEVEENEATRQEVNGRELTLEEYLRDRLNDIDSLVLELGEDALYYPYAVAEPLENRRGGFGGITGVEPYTVIPETDEYGDIVRWIQTTENWEQDMFSPDELVHFPLNKSSARDKTGISSILRSREEIEQFRANQQAIKSAIELHGFPQRHVKVGRDGSAPIRDNELRRVRNLFDSQTVDSDTVFVTGNDVEIDALEAENFEFERVSENDMRQLSLALGVPLELTNYGSDGLGSGKPAEFRLNLFKLQIEANQRQFANIFVRDLLRPVLRDMTPFNHTVNINMEFGDPLQTETDMAALLNEIGDYMTNEEVADRFDLPMPENDEIADAYRPPAEVERAEAKEEAEGGSNPLDALPLADGETDFSHVQLAEIPEKYTDGTGLSESDFVPNSDVADVIEPVLEFIDEYGLPNPDNQQEGAARINQLQNAYENDDPIHPDFWQEIANFHARHRAQGNHECDESGLPEKAAEINQNEFEPCLFDPGYFSDKTWGGTPGMEQAERIVDAIESTEGVELSDHTPEWDTHLLDVHSRIFDNGGKELLEFSDSQTPQFVKDRLRDAIMDGAVFNDIENIGGDDIFQLREFMTETLQSDGWTIDGLADQLQQLDGIESRDKARLIARTETASVVNSAREDGYEERGDGDAKFYWSGDTRAESDRTTEACDWLIRQTNPFEGGTPVPMEELKKLIDEAPTHDPEMQDNLARPDNFVVHPNERKTFVKAPDSMT